jgi:Ca2+-binding EF-hand superfamily protein
MTEVGIEETPDFDVFDNLFTMFDKTGDNMVYTAIFLSSISCLVCREDVREKLQFAIQMFDADQTGSIGKGEMLSILVGINATASYLGDSVIMPKQIEVSVNDAFEKKEKLLYRNTPELHQILGHPNVVQFINAAGTMRYGHSKVGA